MEPSDLTPDMKEKIKDCKTPEDILALAKEDGYELNDDELTQIAGGSWGGDDTPAIVCPNCGSGSFWSEPQFRSLHCQRCDHTWPY